MTAQETKLLNAFETTLTGTIGASDTTLTVNSVTDSASNTLTAPCYLIINPDSATNREVILVTSINTGTKTLTLDNVNKRYLTGSAATSGLSHASGSVVRMSPVQQHIEDLNDRVDTVINEAGTAVNTTLFLDEDNMASNSATKGVTQQSVKAYVDTQLTAEDLDISADSGSNIAIDLDSETLDLEGSTGIDTATGTNKVTFAIDSTVATLSGSQALTNKTIDVDSNTVSNIEVDNLKSGVLDTDLSSTAGTDTTLPSAKAVKTYVDAQVTAQDLDTAGNSGTGAIDLDSQSLTVSGDGTILTSTASGQGITFAIADATTSAKGAASFSSDNFAVSSGAVTIKNGGVDLAAEVTGTLPVANGGTGATSLTDGGVLLGSGTGAVTATSVLTNGQLLIGDGTSDPTVATLTAGTNVSVTNGAGSITIAATDTNTVYTAGTLLDLDSTTFNVDLSEAAEAAIADGDYVIFLDGGATGTAKKENIADVATLFAGTGLTASSSVIGVDASQAITALTGGDLTIYEDANNADVSVKMGTSATESLTIEVLNGSGNKTAEQINFTTATASGTADHGKMVFAVDETTIATIDDGGIDLASGKEFSVNGTALSGGGSLVKLATATASGSSSIDFLGGDTGWTATAYQSFLIRARWVVPASDPVRIYYAFYNDTSLVSGTYRVNHMYRRIDATDANWATSSYTDFVDLLSGTTGTDTREGANFNLEVFPSSDATIASSPAFMTTHRSNAIGKLSNGAMYSNDIVGAFDSASNINGAKIYASSGNIAAGQFDFYGIKR